MKLELKGRTFFDDNEGCIAKAWQSDWHFDNQFPQDDQANAAYQKLKYGISKGTFNSLTMKSMLIAAKKVVDKDDRPLALIVIESLKSDAFDEDKLKEKLGEAARDCAHLLTVWKRHIPSPSAAEDEGL